MRFSGCYSGILVVGYQPLTDIGNIAIRISMRTISFQILMPTYETAVGTVPYSVLYCTLEDTEGNGIEDRTLCILQYCTLKKNLLQKIL